MFKHSILTAAFACVTLAGCTHTSLPTEPMQHYPAQFRELDNSASTVDELWWQAFQAPALNALLAEAEAQSPDWLITLERIRQAEYQLRVANASWFPSVGLSAATGETRSEDPGGNVVRGESSRVGLSVSYEVDLWGGAAATRAAARAGYDASVYDQVAAQLSLRAGIASGWFSWLALQERIATSEKNIAIAERIMQVVDARYRNGVASAADVAQQQTSLLSQRASLLPLQLQAQQASGALAILLGQTPQGYAPPAMALNTIAVPEVAVGVPAQLVLRRPDLATSEANLLAADANLVAARAALFPSLSLSAGAGRSTSELFSLNPATQTANWSIGLAQTLFNGGRLINQKRYTEARRAELLLQYHKAILNALQETDMAQLTASSTQQQEIQQQAIVAQAERSLHLSEVRYREGSDDLLALLNAQRTLFQAQDSLVQQRLARLNAAVDLYKALGGGWQKSAQE